MDVDLDLTDVLTDDLTDDLTAVKCNVIVLCNLHTREMLLSFPAADAAAPLLLCAVVLHKCNWWGYVITG